MLVIDTDLPVTTQALQRQDLATDAAIDSVRIQVLDEAPEGDPEQLYDRQLLVPDPSAWPIQLGLASPETGTSVRRVRIRAFKQRWAPPNDEFLSEPSLALAVDRTVELELPVEGAVIARIVLAGDCRGVASSFSKNLTCIDAARTSNAPTTGIELLEAMPAASTLVGTWPAAHPKPCSSPAPEGALCVPGSFAVIGDEVTDHFGVSFGTLPRMPAIVRPFYLDATEFTVGRFKALLASGFSPPTMPSGQEYDCSCTWQPESNADDALPLNCIDLQTARAACRFLGGDLPLEVQLEHAARRARAMRYVWGNDPPETCVATFGKSGGCPTARVGCVTSGIAPTGCAPSGRVSCARRGDETPDGILDLAGNLEEATRDRLVAYGEPCWFAGADRQGGIPIDPSCAEAPPESAPRYAARGGDWTSGMGYLAAAIRRSWVDNSVFGGFRCAYGGDP